MTLGFFVVLVVVHAMIMLNSCYNIWLSPYEKRTRVRRVIRLFSVMSMVLSFCFISSYVYYFIYSGLGFYALTGTVSVDILNACVHMAYSMLVGTWLRNLRLRRENEDIKKLRIA